MANFTVNITPVAVNSLGAKWCIVGKSRWYNSGDVTTIATAGDIISFRYINNYFTPTNITITSAMLAAGSTTATYVETQWLASWGAPMCGCFFRGQVILGGKYLTTQEAFPSDSRIVRWSEIGAFRFLGATANAKKNEAGFTYTSEYVDECVMSILPLKNGVVVYSTMSIFIMKPASSPAPTYSIDEFKSGIGILHPLAVAGHKSQHVLVTKEGYLCKVYIDQYGQTIFKNMGYQHIFAPMQDTFSITSGTGIVAIVYNPDDDEYYISDGITSYLFHNDMLFEIGATITSYINTNPSIMSDELFQHCGNKKLGCVSYNINKNDIYLETDIQDFGLSAIKTIQQVEIAGGYNSDQEVYVMVKWRNKRSDEFRETEWRRCSPNGVATPIVSGTDFRICAKITPLLVEGRIINPMNVEISNITVEWKLIDKSSVRGNYASSSAA
jgi:hypothetical protein